MTYQSAWMNPELSAFRDQFRRFLKADLAPKAEGWRRAKMVDRDAWRAEVVSHEEFFIKLHDHLPPEIVYERELLICRL